MRPLGHILSAETTFAGFLDRRRNELAILHHVRRNLPPALAAQVGIAAVEPPELALLASSGAVGALLRQRVPDLVEKLAHAGWQFTGIRVRVQPRPPPRSPKKHMIKQLDGLSVATLRAHAERLADPELAAALRRLADHGAAPSDDEEALGSVEKQRSE
jgi:Dna[CI] antecedent, DciA